MDVVGWVEIEIEEGRESGGKEAGSESRGLSNTGMESVNKQLLRAVE